jgi:7-cyano-7-deazaguanine synthase
MAQSRAVILLSGGLDSATVLAIARQEGRQCYALSVDYGQRHRAELVAAARVAQVMGAIEHRSLRIDLGGIGGSALTDASIAVPETPQIGIPVTYVPARNTVMLSFALGWAEVLAASSIYIGVNAVDYSGYPDCRQGFIDAFQRVANLATKAAVEGVMAFRIETPLMDLTKAQIIQRGRELGVDYSLTVSCYQADQDGRACGSCDACRLRRAGFRSAGVEDPTRYFR